LLFLISGVALRFAWDKAIFASFISRRILVLFVPLLFGMVVICAPQAWYELLRKEEWSGSVWGFYVNYINWPWASPDTWSIITPTWNHLWYLLYVLVYTVVLLVLSQLSKRSIDRVISDICNTAGVLLIVPIAHITVLFALFGYLGESQTLWGDWYNLTASFLIFSFGFAIAKAHNVWSTLHRARYATVLLALIMSALVTADHFDLLPLHTDRFSEMCLRLLQGWSIIWALLGWGQCLLNRPSKILSYLSGAVFTYYVLHQTVIIMIGVPLSKLGYALAIESGLLILATFAICALFYHFIARKIGRFGILIGARNTQA